MRTLRHCSPMGLVLCCLLTLSAVGAKAQTNLENVLTQYPAEEVKGYIQPLGDLFGANINAGLFHGADISGTGFHMKFEIIGIGSSVGDDQKVYTAKAPAGFTPATFQSATLFGGTGALVTDAATGLSYRGSDGLINTSLFPDAVLQVTLGNIFGTRAAIRFAATPKISDLPPAQQWGIGVQHSISQYLSVIPLDVAAHVFYNRFRFGDIIDLSGYSIGLDASKSFSLVTLYGGLAVESSSMNVTYTPSNATVPAVNIDLDGINKFRALVGLTLNLGFFSVFGDVNFGSVTNFAAGIGFGG